jgi:hypothetical protein
VNGTDESGHTYAVDFDSSPWTISQTYDNGYSTNVVSLGTTSSRSACGSIDIANSRAIFTGGDGNCQGNGSPQTAGFQTNNGRAAIINFEYAPEVSLVAVEGPQCVYTLTIGTPSCAPAAITTADINAALSDGISFPTLSSDPSVAAVIVVPSTFTASQAAIAAQPISPIAQTTPDEQFNEEEAVISYTWEATAYSPQYCTADCGANAVRTRTVVCSEISVLSTGEFNRRPADDEASCTENKPTETSACDTVPVGATCVDGNDETMNDVCIAGDTCEGKVQLASVAMFPLDIATLVVPNTSGLSEDAAVALVDASPVAVAVKGGLSVSLAIPTTAITVKSIAAGSVVVDYVVALLATEVLAAKTASEDAAPVVTIPAEAFASGEALAEVVGDMTPLTSYAYAYASTCGVGECSVACDARVVSAADVYSCLKDGVVVALPLCHPTLGEPVATTTECCPAADPATCVHSAASIAETWDGTMDGTMAIPKSSTAEQASRCLATVAAMIAAVFAA